MWLKKSIVKVTVLSVVLYGYMTTGALRQEEINRPETFAMWMWKRMEKSS